jgi:hypothetical protein
MLAAFAVEVQGQARKAQRGMLGGFLNYECVGGGVAQVEEQANKKAALLGRWLISFD